jgi:cytoskeleton protein RodZ
MTTENKNENSIPEILPTETIQVAPATPEPTIGEYLRQKREEKGLSLKFISQQTKIHIGLLENLETNQLDKLPSKTYIRGFVKSTTKLLGLNQEYTLKLLDQTYSQNKPLVVAETPNIEMRNETARNTLSAMTTTHLETVRSVTASSGVFLAKSAVVIIIVGVIGFNVKNFLNRMPEEDEVKLPEVLTTLHQKQKAPAPKPVEKALPAETTPSEPIEINLIQDKNQKNNVVVNNINLQTISIGEKQFVEDNSMTVEQISELLPAKYRIVPTKGIETLFLNASEGDSWLTYKVDDKEIKKFVLRQGRTLFLRGAVIRLFIGNTKTLKAFHNNKPVNLSVNNKSGVKNIVLPEELKTKFMAPLFVFLEDGTVVTSDQYIKENQTKTPGTSAPVPESSPTKRVKVESN